MKLKTITVNASRKYDVVIGKGCLSDAGEMLAERHSPCRIMLVADDRVDAIWAQTALRSLADAGFEVSRFVFRHGEGSKNPKTLARLWETMANSRLTRSDMAAALGGGVTGDLTGFAASTFLRGIEYIQLPTSLLAMVDSSVGGKTAVDLAAGKNLAGTFWQPSLVVCDTETLSTLPDDIRSDGMAEVIKYGMINRPEILNALENGCDDEELVAMCVDDKRVLVEYDEHDRGSRALLNFGHTVGHAVERCSGYNITHGNAVAIGMAVITRSAAKAGICPRELPSRLEKLLAAYGLPTSCPYGADELADAAMNDKKASGSTITLIMPYDAGDSRLYKTDISGLKEIIEAGL